ncbi:MAG: DUF559 domain-containing protein [Alphaproteobacteria bacterium]|nr:DUF559 domain-containing protein [Alphaproteobacteria bacterium]
MKANLFSKELRAKQTEAEKLFWSKIRGRKFENVKFRRQVPLGNYILDFVCFDLRLVVEIDGGQHCECQTDQFRDSFLEEEGFLVKRYWNNEVLGNIEGVLADLIEVATPLRKSPHPNPLPQGAREQIKNLSSQG